MVRATASAAGSITLIEAPSRLTTHRLPSGARAMLRGALPVAISARRVGPAVSNTLTESLSGLTTHSRAAALPRGSSSICEDARGAPLAAGSVTACRKLRVLVWPVALRTVSVTR